MLEGRVVYMVSLKLQNMVEDSVLPSTDLAERRPCGSMSVWGVRVMGGKSSGHGPGKDTPQLG